MYEMHQQPSSLVIPFALMGVALVFMLLVCRLTVATGTFSGLMFYANIVGANGTIFLPVKSTDALSVFIAWISLDFGIETCFMKEWMLIAKHGCNCLFPAYIWTLVVLIILVSQYSQQIITEMCGCMMQILTISVVNKFYSS